MSRSAALLLAVLALAGCGNLALRQDERLEFRSPAERSRLTPPVTVEWSGPRGFNGRYGVFVDRSPMRAGRDLDSLADLDPICRRLPSCPNQSWLRDRDVHVTRAPRLRLPGLPLDGGRRAGRMRRHEVTVVLLDRRGVRFSEAQWTRSFYTPDRGRD